MGEKKVLVAIIMGSKSDLEIMKEAAKILDDFEVGYEMKIVSAHRTPELMFEYARTAKNRGFEVIIAGAGGAAHLPGMTASLTTLPVIGVPIESRTLKGIDSLLSIVQMPAGVPVATMAIGNSKNASLMALRILSIKDDKLATKLQAYMEQIAEEVKNTTLL